VTEGHPRTTATHLQAFSSGGGNGGKKPRGTSLSGLTWKTAVETEVEYITTEWPRTSVDSHPADLNPVQLSYITQHRTVLIIFSLVLQTVIIAQMPSLGGEGIPAPCGL